MNYAYIFIDFFKKIKHIIKFQKMNLRYKKLVKINHKKLIKWAKQKLVILNFINKIIFLKMIIKT